MARRRRLGWGAALIAWLLLVVRDGMRRRAQQRVAVPQPREARRQRSFPARGASHALSDAMRPRGGERTAPVPARGAARLIGRAHAQLPPSLDPRAAARVRPQQRRRRDSGEGDAAPRAAVFLLEWALAHDDRPRTAHVAQVICDELCAALQNAAAARPGQAERPSDVRGSCTASINRPGGARSSASGCSPPSAARSSYKTFLRTLVHEMGHHLDYQLLHLEDSFHTDGFLARVEPREPAAGGGAARRRAGAGGAGRRRSAIAAAVAFAPRLS